MEGRAPLWFHWLCVESFINQPRLSAIARNANGNHRLQSLCSRSRRIAHKSPLLIARTKRRASVIQSAPRRVCGRFQRSTIKMKDHLIGIVQPSMRLEQREGKWWDETAEARLFLNATLSKVHCYTKTLTTSASPGHSVEARPRQRQDDDRVGDSHRDCRLVLRHISPEVGERVNEVGVGKMW